MMNMLREEEDPRALGHEDVFDTYKYVGSRRKAYDTWLQEEEARLEEAMKAKADEAGAKPGKKKKGEAPEN
jgi:hypothetical protein